MYKKLTYFPIFLCLFRIKVYQVNRLFPFFEGLISEGWPLKIASKSWKLNQNDRMGLNFHLSEKQILNSFNRFLKAEKKMKQEIKYSFLSPKNQTKYVELLGSRLFMFK